MNSQTLDFLGEERGKFNCYAVGIEHQIVREMTLLLGRQFIDLKRQ
jgi:hypothetical protein